MTESPEAPDVAATDDADRRAPTAATSAAPPTRRRQRDAPRTSPTCAGLEREGEIAADYLEELLDIADLDGDIDMDVERDRAAVSVVGGDLDDLVGREGVVLEALQELTRLAVLTQTGERSRLMLDVGGYRAGRRAVLTELGPDDRRDRCKATGEKVRLEPMTPVRAQDRARRRGGGRAAQRVRGRGAAATRRRPARPDRCST